ncbi:hypothetical protein [Microcoleus vaginatus]|uniref:hypothetical protein n=1 Tax=Microcoleus vaginatus TaxID=119532 RepID=UPI0032A75076
MSKKALALISDGGNDYIVTIKKNQSNLFKVAQKLVKSTPALDLAHTSERLHGRTTTRHTTIYPMAAQLLPAWAGAKRIIARELAADGKVKKAVVAWLISMKYITI